MEIDKSSYYPTSPLDEEPPEYSSSPEQSEKSGRSDKSDKSDMSGKSENSIRRQMPDPATDEYEFDDPAPKAAPPETGMAITRFSNILSWVLVPLMMPVYGTMLAFGLSVLKYTPLSTRLIFTLIVACFNMAVPAAMVLLLKKLGFVNDLGLNGRRERLIPYIISILCLGGTAWFMAYKHAPMWLVMFYAGGAAAGVVECIINLRWKISVHSAGIAGIVALIMRIILDGYPSDAALAWLIISILLAGLLGTARVWLRRHTVWQVLAGYVVGFCSIFFITMIQ